MYKEAMLVRIIVSVFLLFSTASALSCWECNDVADDEECMAKGKLTLCHGSQQACQVELRYQGRWGEKPRITKRCKQALACKNNFNQNTRGSSWYTQCNPKSRNTVCRCCCHDDNCNYEAKKCWNERAPKICSRQYQDINFGHVSCSKSNSVESVCGFACNHGYKLMGEGFITCTKQLQWSSPKPTCQAISCTTAPKAPKYGSVSCYGKHSREYRCKFACNSEYKLEGSETTTCTQGKWSTPSPTCRGGRVCKIKHNSIVSGFVSCSKKNNIGSVCGFACNNGNKLVGSGFLTCMENQQWDHAAPSCLPGKCKPIHRAPTHGSVKCTNQNKLTSRCTFSCIEGYQLVGSSVSVCSRKGKWSFIAPHCKKSQAEVCSVKLTNIANGFVSCSAENKVGSVCGFACSTGYKLVGEGFLTCTKKLKWDNAVPKCKPVTCMPYQVILKHGSVNCTYGNNHRSQCRYTCRNGFEIEGSSMTMCSDDGRWSTSPPLCKEIPIGVECRDQGRLPRGEIRCSENNKLSSTCQFECTSLNYTLYPPQNVENTCQENASWNRKKPCCARPCPGQAVMDFILVLDSSSSMGIKNWLKMVEFLKSFMSDFTVSSEATNFGVFRYNDRIDSKHQILLKDYRNDITPILEGMTNMPYDGSGTHTGNALKHALEVMLAEENGNRPGVKDVLFLITDGFSQDSVDVPAKKLRSAGVKTFVLPVKPSRGKLNMAQLNAMAGSENNLIMAAVDLGFEALTTEFSNELRKVICGNPCDYVLPETPMERLMSLG